MAQRRFARPAILSVGLVLLGMLFVFACGRDHQGGAFVLLFSEGERAHQLWLDSERSSSVDGVASGRGEAEAVTFSVDEDGHLRLSGEMSLAGFRIDEMRLELRDDDDDGRADALAGRASGTGYRWGMPPNDFANPYDVEGTVTGELDREPPVRAGFDRAGGGYGAQHFIEAVWVNEAVDPNANYSLDGGGMSFPLTPDPEMKNGVTRLLPPPGHVLPFGATLDLVGDPTIRDLGGNAVDRLRVVETPPAPALIAEATFESGGDGSLSGQATLVTEVASKPAGDAGPGSGRDGGVVVGLRDALSGTRSLQLDERGGAQFRFAREANEARFRMLAYVPPTSSPCGSRLFRGFLSSPSGTSRIELELPHFGDGVVEVLAELPPSFGAEIVVELFNPSNEVRGGCSSWENHPLVVDDLRLE